VKDEQESSKGSFERRLVRIEDDVQELKDGQKRLEGGQEKYFKILIDTINQYRAEDQRHIEVLMEHHKSETASFGEGFKSNRERLDDHEVRIQDLEAS
jgi:hypothetical protein